MQAVGKEIFMLTESGRKMQFPSSLTYWKISIKELKNCFKGSENQLFEMADGF